MAEKENFPPPKKRRLSLKLNRNRFKKATEVDVSDAMKGFVPKNTARCNKWAVNNFESWRSSLSNEKFPEDILFTDDKKLLCDCLCRFVLETRKASGEEYPPKTIFNILSGLLRHLRENKNDAVNFLDQSISKFIPLHNVMDSYFRQLHSKGIGTNPHQSEIITMDEEKIMWTKGVLGIESPKQLLYAVFYYCGLNLCLRGGDEHRGLRVSQFTRLVVPDPKNANVMTVCYEYTEHGSKNNLGGVKQVRNRKPNKVVRHFANQQVGNKCLVRLLDLYLSKRPQFEPEAPDSDAFYLRPLEKFEQCKCWFYARAIGHNTLKGMVKTICKEAGLSIENRSNHSLRATAATRLMDAGVAEKVIMDRTGHHSSEGLKPYARVTDYQQQQLSEVLTSCGRKVSEKITTHSETSVLQELSCENIEEKMKGVVTNIGGQMSGCVFNVSFN